jgi:hypothetical protein
LTADRHAGGGCARPAHRKGKPDTAYFSTRSNSPNNSDQPRSAAASS